MHKIRCCTYFNVSALAITDCDSLEENLTGRIGLCFVYYETLFHILDM